MNIKGEHEAVEHGRARAGIHAVLALREVVLLLDARVGAAANSDHPQELVNVVT